MDRSIFLAFVVLFTSAAVGQQCFVPGECVGQLLGAISVGGGAEGCLSACQATSECTWFTSYGSDLCGLFINCDELNVDGCPECVSGKDLQYTFTYHGAAIKKYAPKR